MPRRNASIPDDTLGALIPEVIQLPVPQPHKQREHWEDPLTPMVGASPTGEPPKRKRGRPRKNVQGEELQEQTKARKALGDRYDRYLDLVVKYNGSRITALADLYDIDVGEASLCEQELHNEVMLGAGVSSISDLLKKQDVGKGTRVAILKKHMFSENPAASLKAADMLNDMDDSKHDQMSSYEAYLAVVMEA